MPLNRLSLKYRAKRKHAWLVPVNLPNFCFRARHHAFFHPNSDDPFVSYFSREPTDEPTCERTNGRTNERTNERTNQRANERTDEPTSERTNGRTSERANERTNGRTNERTNERTDGPASERMKERTNQRVNERTNELFLVRLITVTKTHLSVSLNLFESESRCLPLIL